MRRCRTSASRSPHGALPSTWPRRICRKSRAASTLPIALGILAASGQIPSSELDRYEFAGELSLSGGLRPVRGALAMTFATGRTSEDTKRTFTLPKSNADEAALVTDASIYPAATLLEVCAHFAALDDGARLPRYRTHRPPQPPRYPDFSDVKGTT